jgi:hypothetical protein
MVLQVGLRPTLRFPRICLTRWAGIV